MMKILKFTALLMLYLIQPIAYAQDRIIPIETGVERTAHQRKSNSDEDRYSLENICRKLYGIGKFDTSDRDKNGKASAQLGSFWVYGNTLFYKLKVNNQSNINYDIDFIRFYVRDLKTAKRTVTQEWELYPSYSYGTHDKTVDAQSSGQYVFALDKFPITKDKALFIEVYEKNGGRHLYLRAKQSDIENAKSFQ